MSRLRKAAGLYRGNLKNRKDTTLAKSGGCPSPLETNSSSSFGIVEEVFTLHSPTETMALGKTIGSLLSRGCVLALYGELGSGKTTFIKGVGLSLGIIDPHTIHSPTFNYLHIYEGNYPLYHFDLYRLRSAEEFLGLGFVEFLTEGISCIEWPEHAWSFLPLHTLALSFEHVDTKTRKVTLCKKQTASSI